MIDLDSRIARVEYWRRAGAVVPRLELVSVASVAQLAIVSAPGIAPLRFNLPTDREALDATLAALQAAYTLGRHDVIRQVRGIFDEPRARDGE